jgi:hypothetical protein
MFSALTGTRVPGIAVQNIGPETDAGNDSL